MTVRSETTLRSRVPGYRTSRRFVLRTLRRRQTVKRFAKLLVPKSYRRPDRWSMSFRPGRYFPDGGGRGLPIVAIVAPELHDGSAERLAREVEYAQMMTGSFRPIFVLDNAEFGPFRKRGYIVERVMPAGELATVNPHDSYQEYLSSRVSAIVADYGVSSVVPLPPNAPDKLPASLLRLIGACRA